MKQVLREWIARCIRKMVVYLVALKRRCESASTLILKLLYVSFFFYNYFKHRSLGNKPFRDGALPSRTRQLAFKVHSEAEEQTAKFLCQTVATSARNLEPRKASSTSTYCCTKLSMLFFFNGYSLAVSTYLSTQSIFLIVVPSLNVATRPMGCVVRMFSHLRRWSNLKEPKGQRLHGFLL